MRGRGAGCEKAIRVALRRRQRRHHADPSNILMVDELGLVHAQSRIDFAVFNGHLHGYEIKSANDTLSRLPRQLSYYEVALQKLTLVVATRHVDEAISFAPSWCGLIEVIEGPRGGLTFASRRRAVLNPGVDPFSMAHLLWKPEAQNLLRARGASPSEVNVPRRRLYRMLADGCSAQDLAPSIKAAMASRKGWRDRPRPS